MFDTAVEAAVARARHVARHAPRRQRGDVGGGAAGDAAGGDGDLRPRAAAPTPPPTTVATLPAAAAVAPGETLRAKVDRIKASLELATDLSVMAGIREANALMGLAPDGLSLPEQADRLLAQIG